MNPSIRKLKEVQTKLNAIYYDIRRLDTEVTGSESKRLEMNVNEASTHVEQAVFNCNTIIQIIQRYEDSIR
jgi:hypothetical protein